MRRTPFRAVLLAVLLWLAQMQGMLHGIGHLGSATGLKDLAGGHSLVCADCVGFAQAGAALLPSAPVPLPTFAGHLPPVRAAISWQPVEVPSSYRSRAPPQRVA
jgi:hypothetical protein